MKNMNLNFIIIFLISSSVFAAQPVAPVKAQVAVAAPVAKMSEKTKALLAENELNKRKALESITKMLGKITELKKYRDEAIKYYKTVEKLSTMKIWRMLCNAQVKQEADAENPLAVGRKKTKAEQKIENENWFVCVRKERELSDVNMDSAMMYVLIGNEQVKNAEEAYATSLRYYNAIPGIKTIPIPQLSPPIFPPRQDKSKKAGRK